MTDRWDYSEYQPFDAEPERSCGNPALYDLIVIVSAVGLGVLLGWFVWLLLF